MEKPTQFSPKQQEAHQAEVWQQHEAGDSYGAMLAASKAFDDSFWDEIPVFLKSEQTFIDDQQKETIRQFYKWARIVLVTATSALKKGLPPEQIEIALKIAMDVIEKAYPLSDTTSAAENKFTHLQAAGEIYKDLPTASMIYRDLIKFFECLDLIFNDEQWKVMAGGLIVLVKKLKKLTQMVAEQAGKTNEAKKTDPFALITEMEYGSYKAAQLAYNHYQKYHESTEQKNETQYITVCLTMQHRAAIRSDMSSYLKYTKDAVLFIAQKFPAVLKESLTKNNLRNPILLFKGLLSQLITQGLIGYSVRDYVKKNFAFLIRAYRSSYNSWLTQGNQALTQETSSMLEILKKKHFVGHPNGSGSLEALYKHGKEKKLI